MKLSDQDTILTALDKAVKITAQHGQAFTVCTSDLKLYRVAVDILWAYPDQFSIVVLRLGGMHMLMSFVGSVGTLMTDSGLGHFLESTFAGVPKMLNGKKFPHNVRALRIVIKELLRMSFLENRFQRYSEFEDYLDKTATESHLGYGSTA